MGNFRLCEPSRKEPSEAKNATEQDERRGRKKEREERNAWATAVACVPPVMDYGGFPMPMPTFWNITCEFKTGVPCNILTMPTSAVGL